VLSKKLRWASFIQVQAHTYICLRIRSLGTKTAWKSLPWLFGEFSGQSQSNSLDGFQAMYV
jgi:hypothetical protein